MSTLILALTVTAMTSLTGAASNDDAQTHVDTSFTPGVTYSVSGCGGSLAGMCD